MSIPFFMENNGCHMYRLSFDSGLNMNENLDIITELPLIMHISFIIIFRFLFSPHPYLFFNQDRCTLTFLGFFINSNGDLVDPQASTILESGLMPQNLRNGLYAQKVDFTVNSNNRSK